MATSRLRDAFEGELQRLVGRSLRGVSYREIAYEHAVPEWSSESTSFDSLDFGLELRLDDASIISFTWGTEFVQYNVSMVDGELQLGDIARSWDVGERWRALGLLGSIIVGASGVWVPSDRSPVTEYPQEVRLVFDTGRVVVISAFEQRGEALGWGMMDHITVFFDEAEAQRLARGAGWPR